MPEARVIRRPLLAAHARYRWDRIRQQHQLVFPEGMIELNESGAAIVKLCDGRSTEELVAVLTETYPGSDPGGDVAVFLQQLAERGLLRDGARDGIDQATD